MKRLGIIVGLLTGLAYGASCDSAVGSCVSSGGIVDTCKPDWTREECEEWDAEGINDADWTFSRKDCDERGFTVKCEYDETRVRTASDC